MRLRVEELSGRSGVSVDTIRYYQSRGLLDPPTREGRVGWYSEAHLDRLQRIRSLKDRGLNLAAIRLMVDGSVDPVDAGLVAVLEQADPDGGLSVEEFARRTGLPSPVIEAIAREGLIPATSIDGSVRFREADIEMVQAGVSLLEAGLPLDELLALARIHDEEMRKVADRAVELFIRFVRDPLRASGKDDDVAARLRDSFDRMLPATTALVANHFRGLLVEAARARAGLTTGRDTAMSGRLGERDRTDA